MFCIGALVLFLLILNLLVLCILKFLVKTCKSTQKNNFKHNLQSLHPSPNWQTLKSGFILPDIGLENLSNFTQYIGLQSRLVTGHEKHLLFLRLFRGHFKAIKIDKRRIRIQTRVALVVNFGPRRVGQDQSRGQSIVLVLSRCVWVVGVSDAECVLNVLFVLFRNRPSSFETMTERD